MEKDIGKKRLRGIIPKIGIRLTIDGKKKGFANYLKNKQWKIKNRFKLYYLAFYLII
jgi:hypothetical protein